MFKPSVMNRVEHGIYLRTKSVLAPMRRRKLNNTDFTIISNNCWGGICYEHFGLRKNSPTVGTFFFADDYIRFVSNLRYYLNLDLRIITSDESKHNCWLRNNSSADAPIGLLEDVEICFLHYKDPDIARDKWNKRIQRINYNNLIFKFSYMNECTIEHLKQFDSLDLPGKKIMFIKDNNKDYECGVYYPGFEQEAQITNDTYFWNKYFDVISFINRGIIRPC